MRFIYGLGSMLFWCIMLRVLFENGIELSNNTLIISIAIVAAGAMAGGD